MPIHSTVDFLFSPKQSVSFFSVGCKDEMNGNYGIIYANPLSLFVICFKIFAMRYWLGGIISQA